MRFQPGQNFQKVLALQRFDDETITIPVNHHAVAGESKVSWYAYRLAHVVSEEFGLTREPVPSDVTGIAVKNVGIRTEAPIVLFPPSRAILPMSDDNRPPGKGGSILNANPGSVLNWT